MINETTIKEMSIIDALEAYKNDNISMLPQDLQRPDHVMVFSSSTFMFESAIFLKYSSKKIIAIRDRSSSSDLYSLWFTFKENNNDPTGEGVSGNGTTTEEPENQTPNETTQGEGEEGNNAEPNNGQTTDNGGDTENGDDNNEVGG